MTWHLRVKFTHTHFSGAERKGWHTLTSWRGFGEKCRLHVPLPVSVCACVFVCVGAVQVRLMLAPDLQAHGNKQQSRQEARCNSTNF